MHFKTIAGRSDGVLRRFPTLSEDQDFVVGRIHQNYLVALTPTGLVSLIFNTLVFTMWPVGSTYKSHDQFRTNHHAGIPDE